MARLYANENIPLQVVVELRRRGHDVLTLLETGLANRRVPDVEVLLFASNAGRAVLTLNRKHFIRLHSARPDHFGIVVCTVDPDFVEQARRNDAAIAPLGDLSGKLVRVNRPAIAGARTDRAPTQGEIP